MMSLPRHAAPAASIVALFFAYAAAPVGRAGWRANLISTHWNTSGNQVPIDSSGPIPILAFSFDHVTSSNVSDDSGSGNLYTSEAMDADGLFTPTTDASFRGSGKALHLDGTRQQRIEIAGAALTVQAFTIMADVRLSDPVNFTDPAQERWEICEKAGSYWANIRMDQGLVIPGPPYLLRVGGFFDGTAGTSFLGVRGLTPGTWTNVALVFDPVAHTLSSYINGVLDHTEPRSGTLDTSISHNGIDENLVVGAKHRLGGPGEDLEAFFDGQMDNFRLYNVALTPREIAYLAGTPVHPRPHSKLDPSESSSVLKGDSNSAHGCDSFAQIWRGRLAWGPPLLFQTWQSQTHPK